MSAFEYFFFVLLFCGIASCDFGRNRMEAKRRSKEAKKRRSDQDGLSCKSSLALN